MKRILGFLTLSAALFCTLHADAAGRKMSARETARLERIGLDWLDQHFQDYHALQSKIHDYAELGYKEVKSSEELARHLEAQGFRVERAVAGIPTAFVATFGSGSPVIGLMAEYDALPGMSQDTVSRPCPVRAGGPGHGCGHNVLGTAAVAGAEAIARYLAEGHPGTVKLFGCPAEEGGGGKAYMTMRGCFDGMDVVLDWHPARLNFVSLGGGYANVSVRFTFHGRSAHASAAPWNGRSALDAVEALDYMMNLMREHLPEGSQVHYVITDGGKAPNVVPDRAEVFYYLRHPRSEVVRDLLDRALKAAEGAALGTGTTMEYELVHGNYERLINRHLAEMLHRNMLRVGGLRLDGRELRFLDEVFSSSGIAPEERPDHISKMTEVVPTLLPPTAGGGSSDVGNVSQVVPLAKIDIATGPVGIHTWQMAATAGTTIGTKGALNAARVMYLTALQLYTRPEDLRAVREEFEAARGKDFKFEPLMGWREPPFHYRDGLE